ncbi:c-type cytochrome [Staphylospora marina]|uniref:c-type cytochrome n=1 Tax=Staphylospora marina TaxID=2490858 RepID=UPI000F5B9320|nr:cytochrome c [Staphylospora marina]
MRKAISVLAGCSLLLLTAACNGNPSQTDRQSAQTPEELYMNNCAACHGGNMQGSYGPGLKGVGQKLGKEGILQILNKGKGTMPAQTHMSQQDREKLAEWLSQEQ